MNTENIIDLYRSQLLWGSSFLNDFGEQLESLYSDSAFMREIHKIQAKCPAEESNLTIEQIKQIAKTTLYEDKVYFDFPAFKSIADSVAQRGSAKNSAAISIYCAMRIFDLAQSEPVKKGTTQPAPVVEKEPGKNELDFRLKWPAEFRCEDGHYVRSRNEALVDNWLYHHDVCHAYEKAVFSKDAKITYCSDFFLPRYNLFIEIWGMNDSAYETRRKRKTAFYRDNGYSLLEIFGDEIKNLDDILSKALRK